MGSLFDEYIKRVRKFEEKADKVVVKVVPGAKELEKLRVKPTSIVEKVIGKKKKKKPGRPKGSKGKTKRFVGKKVKRKK